MLKICYNSLFIQSDIRLWNDDSSFNKVIHPNKPSSYFIWQIRFQWNTSNQYKIFETKYTNV